MKRIVSFDENIKVDDGIFFGAGVFETMLVLDSVVDFEFHIKRLNNAIYSLGLGEAINKDIFESIVRELKNCVLKILVTEKNIIVQKRLVTYTREDYENGFKLKLSKVIKSSKSKLIYYKTTNYYENILEKRLAQKEGFNEPIFRNENGFITEGATSNIFIIKDNNIYTPRISCGLLNGTVRQWVMDNFNVIEDNLTIEDLKEANGIFITNSIIGIMKVSYFEDIKYSDTIIMNKIIKKYKTYLKNFGGASIE